MIYVDTCLHLCSKRTHLLFKSGEDCFGELCTMRDVSVRIFNVGIKVEEELMKRLTFDDIYRLIEIELAL